MKRVKTHKTLITIVLTCCLVLGVAYLAIGKSLFEPTTGTDIVGTWVGNQIVTDSESAIYENTPVALQFRKDGTFLSTNQEIISSGNYEVVGNGKIKIGQTVFQLVDYSDDVVSIGKGKMDGSLFLSRW